MMDTLYSKIGPASLKKLVNTFYDIVFDESSISHLFTNEKSSIRDKQYRFLTQFLGGPQLYTSEYGQPKMRMRHAPHAIDETARIEWLRCMKLAISKMDFEPELGEALYNCFPRVAAHMQNR